MTRSLVTYMTVCRIKETNLRRSTALLSMKSSPFSSTPTVTAVLFVANHFEPEVDDVLAGVEPCDPDECPMCNPSRRS